MSQEQRQQVAREEKLVPSADRLKENPFYEFGLDDKKFIVDVKVFKEILDICPRVPNEDFVTPLSEEDLLAFLIELGYKGPLDHLAKMFVDYMHQPWRILVQKVDLVTHGKNRTATHSHIYVAKGSLLNILGKTKYGINVRKDMVEMGIRPELAPVEREGSRMYLPTACYTMSKAEKTKFCQCLHGVKVPSGYSSNVKKLVSMNDLKLLGMKSHDCHILITQLILIAIRGILSDRIRHTITKLCLFFNMIHSKVIDPEVLDEWQSDIILTLCQLEMYFPPSFFDVMVHLVSHIVGEIKACGPTFLRNMYPFERYMGFLKGYVTNRYRPEASIIQGYVTEEQQDEKSTLQNSGVKLIADTPEFSMGDHDARLMIAKKSYYGVIQEIWELDYLSYKIKLNGEIEGNNLMVCKSLILVVSTMLAGEMLSMNPLLDNEVKEANELLERAGKEASKCQLFIPYGTNKVLYVIGMVYPAKQVHGKSVLQGHAKVHVDKASNSNQTGNKKIVATNTSTQIVTKQTLATNKEPSTLKQTLPTLSRLEVPFNHISAAPLTKSARPLNSASKEKQELIKKMNSYRGQILKRACVRTKSTFCTSGTLATIINKCLFGKTSSNDRLRQSRVAILWGMFYKKNVDFPELIWEDFAYQIDIRQAKLRILEIMPYPRFNKIIINLFLSLNPSIPKGPSSGMHTIKDDGLISRLKFVRIGEDFQEYGRAIPETTLTKGIKQSEAYQTFIKYSIGLIPSKKSKGKGSQGKKLVVTPKPASVKVFDESDPEPTKRKTCSRRKSRKKVSISADDNIIPEPAIALELGKSMSLTKAEEEEAASRVHATHEHTLSVSKKKSPDQSQKLKGIQTLTAKEQLVADTMQALKAIIFTTLSEGTGTKLGVPDEVKGSSKAKDIEWLTTEEEEEKNDDDEDDRSIDIEKTNDDKETDDEFVHGDEYVHDNVDEEMKDVEVADTRKDDEEITDAEKAKVEKTKELKGDNKKAKLPLTSSSLSVSSKFGNQFLTYSSDISLTGTLKDTANAEINSLLDIQILQEVPHISSLSILTVP
ncbi:reverse transcriptase, partial [Tanacetum coccineum]